MINKSCHARDSGASVQFNYFIIFEYAPFGDKTVNQCSRCYIERGVVSGNSFRSNEFICKVSYLAWIPFFDLYAAAFIQVEIDGRDRGGDIKWDMVIMSKDGQRICSDLVGRVPVRGNAVRPGYNQIDFPSAMTVAAQLSVIRITSMPPRCNSKAVSRAPCRYGLVSHANTANFFPS